MTVPLVSVVLPVRNVDRFVAQAIESVLAQRFTDFELIIIDFGSSDRSKLIASEYEGRDHRVILREIPPCVLPAARNAGCALAQGKYIAVMDADDVCLPNRVEREVRFMEQHASVAFVGAAIERIGESGGAFSVEAYPSDGEELKSLLAARCVFWHPTLLIRTDALRSVGGYRPAFVCSHDYDLELRLSEKFACANLPEVLLQYRIHPSQLSFRRQQEQTLCKLAAQRSAAARRAGQADPLEGVSQITPALLNSLGVSEVLQQSEMVSDCRNWIRNMIAVGEYSAALEAANELLKARLPFVERWQTADLYLTASRLHWKRRDFAKSLLALSMAIWTRPLVFGRPVRPLLNRIWPARRPARSSAL